MEPETDRHAEHAAEVLVEGPFAPADVRIEWRNESVRMPAEAEARIETLWSAYMAEAARQGQSLFNGAITRWIEATTDGGGVRMTLGPGDYKQFVTTVLRDRRWFEAHAPGCGVAAVGNSVLLTQGEEALLGVRSARVSIYGGRAHLVGGVLDRLGALGKFAASVQGVIEHLRMELSEEFGLEAEELTAEPRLLAVLWDEVPGQPELAWQWETRVELGAVARRRDEQEHSGVEIVRRGAVSPEVAARMTPVARATVKRWQA